MGLLGEELDGNVQHARNSRQFVQTSFDVTILNFAQSTPRDASALREFDLQQADFKSAEFNLREPHLEPPHAAHCHKDLR